MCRLVSELYVGLATFDVATRHTCCAGCECISAFVKVNHAVYGSADLSLPLHFYMPA